MFYMARIYRTRLAYNVQGENCLATMSFLSTVDIPNSSAGSRALGNALGFNLPNGVSQFPFVAGSYAEKLSEFFVNTVTFSSLYIFAPYSTGLFESNAAGNAVGVRGSLNPAPAFISAALVNTRTSTAFRSGSRRFSGLDEGDFEGDALLNPDAENALTAMAQVLNGSIIGNDSTTDYTFDAVIEKLDRVVDPVSQKVKYVDWANEATALNNIMVGMRFSPGKLVTTQNTRKVNRGS